MDEVKKTLKEAITIAQKSGQIDEKLLLSKLYTIDAIVNSDMVELKTTTVLLDDDQIAIDNALSSSNVNVHVKETEKNVHDDTNTSNSSMRALTAKQYAKNKTKIVVDNTYNLYFRILPPNWAIWWYFNVVLNKKYTLAVISIVIVLILLNILFAIFGLESVTPGTAIVTSAFIISYLWVMSLVLGFSIEIMRLITKTFDFQFKLVNLIGILIGDMGSGRGVPKIDEIHYIYGIFVACWQLTTITALFLCDAAFIQPRLKLAIFLMLTVFCFAYSLFIYLFFDWDSIINPFQWTDWSVKKNTDISCKNILMSGWINIGLFTLKAAYSLFKEEYKKRKNNEKNSRNNLLFRSSTVNQKPYFEFKNTTIEQVINSKGNGSLQLQQTSVFGDD